ncbi:MAG: hypothetical protein Q4E07_00995 [Eubacteriales bacterium]|nr:hypothetical protein [Eubacteriales bacterium]
MQFLGALALILITGYELIIRLDAMIRPLNMFIKMWIGEKIAFSRAISYVDWGMFERPSYLLLCVLAGLIAIIGRKKAGVWVFTAVLASIAFALSKSVKTLLFPGVFNALVNTCLILLFLGSLINLFTHFYFSKKIKEHRIQKHVHSVHYDPFNMHRRDD